MAAQKLLYIGIQGSVLALDRATGVTVWNAWLKGADFVNVAVLDGDLYASTKGEMFCLDPATGAIRWKNTLSGYGRGLVSMAIAGGQAVLIGEKKRRDDQDSAVVT
jgi:outer membrane protein assembly factor BamB